MKAGRSLMTFALFTLTILPLSAETPGDVFTASGIRRGLFVLMDDDAGLAVELATAEPVLHGVSAGDGRVFVVCEDGSIICMGEEKR